MRSKSFVGNQILVLVVVTLTNCTYSDQELPDTRDLETKTSNLQPTTNGSSFRCENGTCFSVSVLHRQLDAPDARAAFLAPNPSARDDAGLNDFLSRVSNLAPDAKHHAWFELEETGPPLSKFRSLKSIDAREEFTEQRRTEQLASQEDVRESIRQSGGRIVYNHWLSNGFIVWAKPDVLTAIALHPDVIDASLDSTGRNNSYSGQEIVYETEIQDLIHYEDYEGSSGGRLGGNIQVAMTDWQNINCDHVGWDDWSGGPSRLDARRCAWNLGTFSWTCGFTSGVCDQNEDRWHGTTTSWAIAGSIEQGQDPAYPGTYTNAQNVRSGILREADIHYMEVSGGCALRAATDRAVSIGADVLVMPLEITDGGDSVLCSTTFDSCGLNSAIRDAYEAGVVVVVGPGNGDDSSCYVEYPGTRSEVLSVGGIYTNEAGGSVFFRDGVRSQSSPQGFTSSGVSLHGGGGAYVDWISLMAPEDINYSFGSVVLRPA